MPAAVAIMEDWRKEAPDVEEIARVFSSWKLLVEMNSVSEEPYSE